MESSPGARQENESFLVLFFKTEQSSCLAETTPIPLLIPFAAALPVLALCLLGAPGLPALLAAPAWVAAALRSLMLAEAALPLALLIAIPASLGLQGAPHALRRAAIGLALLPLLLPLRWIALGVKRAADTVPVPDANIVALLLAHTLPAAAAAFLVLVAGLNGVDPVLARAARAGGAGSWTAWRLAILPDLARTMPAAASLGFTASVALCGGDAVLAGPFHPTLGAMLAVALRQEDAQAAPAALILAALACAPLPLLAGIRLLRRP